MCVRVSSYTGTTAGSSPNGTYCKLTRSRPPQTRASAIHGWKLGSRAALVRRSVSRGACRSAEAAASSSGEPMGAARRCQCNASSRAWSG